MSQIMARVRVRSGLTRYRSLRTLLTSTGGSSNRVLDGALQASLYSRSAESNVVLDAMFIESSTQYLSSLQPAGRQSNRLAELFLNLLNRRDSRAQGGARRQIVRDRRTLAGGRWHLKAFVVARAAQAARVIHVQSRGSAGFLELRLRLPDGSDPRYSQ